MSGRVPSLSETIASDYALIVLNHSKSMERLDYFWNSAKLKGCADGGANIIYDRFYNDTNHQRPLKNASCSDWHPTFIVGDLDSCRPNVLSYFKDNGVEIAHRPSQEDHDLTKAIDYLHLKYATQFKSIVVLGGLDGRVDHTIAALNTLHSKANEFLSTQIFLVNLQSLAFYIQPGKTAVEVDPSCWPLSCGLLPIYGKVRCITTTGFKWNLCSHTMEMGGLVSSSNLFDRTQPVVITTSDPLLMSIELPIEHV